VTHRRDFKGDEKTDIARKRAGDWHMALPAALSDLLTRITNMYERTAIICIDPQRISKTIGYQCEHSGSGLCRNPFARPNPRHHPSRDSAIPSPGLHGVVHLLSLEVRNLYPVMFQYIIAVVAYIETRSCHPSPGAAYP
jgi:hypothetical protein